MTPKGLAAILHFMESGAIESAEMAWQAIEEEEDVHRILKEHLEHIAQMATTLENTDDPGDKVLHREVLLLLAVLSCAGLELLKRAKQKEMMKGLEKEED